MKNQSKLIFNCWCLLFLFFYSHLRPTPISAQEVEDEGEFDYMEESEKGPLHWGELKKEWKACKHGKLQSPIDLSDQRVKAIPNMGELKMNYKPAHATIKNRGHDISIVCLDDAGSVEINGTNYFLKQCHWHSPSEHSINGRRFDVELHMVHLSPDVNVESKVAVIATLYKLGKPNRFLAKLTKNLISITDTKEEVHKGVIDPGELNIGGVKYYRYIGSLTTPPCTEGVIWTINKRISSVSRKQVSLLREAVHDHAEMNARPLQSLNERDIHLCGPMFRPADSKN